MLGEKFISFIKIKLISKLDGDIMIASTSMSGDENNKLNKMGEESDITL